MKRISQFRFNLFIINEEEYDCSLGGNETVDWSIRGTVQPYFGAYSLMYAAVAIPLYLLSAKVIWTMRRAATYKILFFLAISDIMSLVVNSLAFGVFLLMGDVFCKHPKMHLITGIAAFFFFSWSCIVCLTLALNRMLELMSSRLCIFIFKGSRTWYILTLSLIYPFFLGFFTPVLLFNSDYHFFVVNPGIYDDDRYEYYNVGHIINNTMMPLLSSSTYIIMLLYLLFKAKSATGQDQSSALNRAAVMLSIQSGIIVVVHSTTGITYVISQYIPPSESLLYFAHISWQLLHGIPPLVYMVFNPSLREGIRQYTSPIRSSFIVAPSSTNPKVTTIAGSSQAPKPSLHLSQF